MNLTLRSAHHAQSFWLSVTLVRQTRSASVAVVSEMAPRCTIAVIRISCVRNSSSRSGSTSMAGGW